VKREGVEDRDFEEWAHPFEPSCKEKKIKE
jgi:hypothetical protein